MSSFLRGIRNAVLLLLLLLAVNCPETIAKPSETAFYSWTNLDPGIAPGTLLRYKPMALPAFYRAKAWRILYMTRDYAGRPIVSSGMVVLSGYASKDAAARNIVAYAHPTTGVARKCAPSLRQKPTEAIIGLNELVSGGYVVAATDYPGLATPGPVGYLVGRGQAFAVIDSVRAARQIPAVGGSRRYVMWGYSQGAHAALFGAMLARTHAPELEFLGVAATAPPTNLRDLLYANIDSVSGRILSAMTLHSWSVKYGAPLNSLVDDQVVPVVRAVAANCVDDLSSKLDALASQKPLKQRFLSRDPGKTPPWSDLLQANSMLQLPAGVPAFIAQGTADEIVRPDITLRFTRLSCRSGNQIKYVTLRGADHSRSAKASMPEVMAWIRDRFAGQPLPTSCR